MNRTFPAIVAAAAILAAVPAVGFIERLISLKEVMDSSAFIIAGKVTQVDQSAKTAYISIDRTLKGKTPLRQIKANLGVGQAHFPQVMLKRLRVGEPVVFFWEQNDNNLAGLGHADGIWFQLYGDMNPDPDKVWWRLTHVEEAMNRTYDGPTAELAQIVADSLAGKRQPPPPNPRLPRWTREQLLGGTAPKTARNYDQPPIFARAIRLDNGGGESRSVSWADYDGDGDWDVLICSGNGLRLYRNDAGKFADVTGAAGLRGPARSGAWADYNADGRPDLYAATLGGRPVLWTNQGGKFVDSSALLTECGPYNPEGAGWLDANGDGRPDILLTNGESGIYLYLNQGKGPAWFADVSARWGLGRGGIGSQNGDFLAIADYDGDGFADFLYNVGRGVLARNRDGEAFALAAAAKIDFSCGGAKHGNALTDFDGDGDIDLFVPQPDRSRLYRNNNDGTFTDVIASVPDLATLRGARSAVFADVNRDGRPDLLVALADGPMLLFVNEGNGSFTDQTYLSGLFAFDWLHNVTGMAPADFDGDGDLDLLLTSERGAAVLVNEHKPSKAVLASLRVRLAPQLSPGATVRVEDPRDRLVGLQQIGLVQNFSSQPPPEAIFALPPGKYNLSVLLTDGKVRRTTLDIPARGAIWNVGEKE